MMGVVTRDDEGKRPMTDLPERRERAGDRAGDVERAGDRDERASGGRDGCDHRPVAQGDSQGGFLSLYKPGQGYWTRLGTAGGAAMLLALISNKLYDTLRNAIKIDHVRDAAGNLVTGPFPKWSV